MIETVPRDVFVAAIEEGIARAAAPPEDATALRLVGHYAAQSLCGAFRSYCGTHFCPATQAGLDQRLDFALAFDSALRRAGYATGSDSTKLVIA